MPRSGSTSSDQGIDDGQAKSPAAVFKSRGHGKRDSSGRSGAPRGGSSEPDHDGDAEVTQKGNHDHQFKSHNCELSEYLLNVRLRDLGLMSTRGLLLLCYPEITIG